MTMPGGDNRQAQVTVSANVDPYVKSITAANAATLKFADTLQKVDQAVLKIAKIAGAGAMAVGGAGLLKAFGDVKTSAALENSFKSLAAQATQTGTNVGQVSSEVIKLGTQIPIATQSLAAMATQMAALGVQGTANLKNLTKQAEQLAAATNTAPGALMTGLLQLNQSLGGSLENVSRYGSALTALQAKMGVSSSDVMNFMQGIEAVGAKAGVTEQQMMGMSAAFVKVGADGFAGAQAFNSIVNDMSDAVSRNSPRIQQYANLMGMTGDQFKKLVSSGNSAQAFVDFINAVANSGGRASQILEQFGLDGVRTQRVFAALTSGQANLAQAISETNTAFSQNTAMADASKAAWDGLDSQLVRIQNSATQLKDALGAPLLTPITAISRGFADASASLGNFVHWADDAPWPIGDTLTSLVTKTPALLLLGGAFLTATAAISKFAGAWRMMTGSVGINAFRGFADGRSGAMPRDMGDSGRLGSMLYRRTYSMQQGEGLIGVNSRKGLGSMIMGYPMMRARQQLGQAVDTMKHPFSPEKRDSAKTDPFSMQGMWQAGSRQVSSMRQSAVNHLRAQAGEVDENGNLTSNAQFAANLADRVENGMGPVGDSAEALRRKRFDYVEKARHAAVERQVKINSTMSPTQLRETLAATELGQYVQKNGTEEGFEGTKWQNVGDRQLLKIANDRKNGLAGFVGSNTAQSAGKAFDASMSEEETAKLANPFSKLADKVKSISSELLTSTGDTINGIMDAITAFYQKAVDKITALAEKAKQSVVDVQAYAENPTAQFAVGADGTISRVAGAEAAAAAAGGSKPEDTIKGIADQLKEATGESTKAATEEATKAATQTSQTIIAGGAAGKPLPTAASLAEAESIGFLPNARGAAAATAEGSETSSRASWLRAQNALGRQQGRVGALAARGLSAAGRGAVSVGSAAVNVGRAVGTTLSGLFSPQVMIAATLFGPMLYRMVQSMADAHQKISKESDYAGAAIQQALGRQVTTQQDLVKQQQQKDNKDPGGGAFGDIERKNAMSGDFAGKYQSQIDTLQSFGAGSKNQSRSQQGNISTWLQNYVNGTVTGQNGGKALDDQQMAQVREMVIAAYNGNTRAAQTALNGIDFTGGKGSDWATSLGSSYGRTGSANTRTALSTTSVQNIDTNSGGGAAGILAALGESSNANGGNKWHPRGPNDDPRPGDSIGDKNTGALIQQFVNDYNKAHPNAKIGGSWGGTTTDSPGEFINQIKRSAGQGDKGAKTLWNQIKELGITPNSKGELSKDDLAKLVALTNGTSATGADGQALAPQIADSWLNKAYQKGTGDKKGNITSLLGNPEDAAYGRKTDAVMGALTKGSTVFSPDAIQNMKDAAVAIQAVKDTLAPTDPAWQQLDKLAQTNFANLAQASQLGGGQAFQLSTQTSLVGMMTQDGVTTANHDDIKAQNDALTQQAAQSVQTLNQYWTQVRDANIQQQRGADDHHTQMVRMERDYNVQMGEAQYQFSKQQSEATYSYNIQQREQVYSFQENIRQMKYTLAGAFGNPAQFVQSQYTQGAGSAAIGLQRQLDLMKRSQSALSTLGKQGLSGDAIRLFGLDDPKNVQQAEKYVKDFAANPQLIQTFNQSISDKLNIANAIAQDPNNSQYTELQRQFQHTADLAAESFQHAADVSSDAFTHSMAMSDAQMKTTTADFEADYKLSTSRATADLQRLGEDTTKTWSDVVDWAQKSGIPGVSALGTAAVNAINQANSAAGLLSATLAGAASGFSTTFSQLGSTWQDFINKTPTGRMFAQANGIMTGGGGGTGNGAGGYINYVGPQGDDVSPVREAVVAGAERWLGTDYDWGGIGLDGRGVDCSGLVVAAYRAAGIPFVGRPVASTLGRTGKQVSSSQALPGDIVYYDEPGAVDHVGIYLGNGKMIDSPDVGKKVEITGVGKPTSFRRILPYGHGGVFDHRQTIDIGEGGPETVLPLNAQGAQFVAQTLRASLQMMGANPNLGQEVRRGQMTQYSSPARSEMHIHHTDASTNFTGDITVVAQDPNQMARQLQERKRLQALTRPTARR